MFRLSRRVVTVVVGALLVVPPGAVAAQSAEQPVGTATAPSVTAPVLRQRDPNAAVERTPRVDVATPGLAATPKVSGEKFAPIPAAPGLLVAGAKPAANSLPAAPVRDGEIPKDGLTEFTSLVTNADGSRSLTTSPERINFENADGVWQPIDRRLKQDTDGLLVNTADSWRVSFASLGEGGVTVTDADGGTVSFTVDGAKDVAAVLGKDGVSVTYPDVSPGVDLRYTVLASGVKEDIVLKSSSADPSVAFRVDGGKVSLDPKTRAGSIVTSTGGVMRLTAPTAFDQRGVPVDEGAKPGSGYAPISLADQQAAAKAGGPAPSADAGVLSVGIDPEWLKAQPVDVFPITIDPTTLPNVSPVQGNYRASNNNPANECPSSSGLCFAARLGNVLGVTNRSFARYDMNAIHNMLPYASISGASMSVSENGSAGLPPAPTATVALMDNLTVANGDPSVDRYIYASANSASFIGGVTVTSGSPNGTIGLTPATVAAWATAATSKDLAIVADGSQVGYYYWPQLTVTFFNAPPQVTSTAPADSSVFSTPSGMSFSMSVWDPDPTDNPTKTFTFVDTTTGANWNTGWSAATSYTMPSGLLKWNTWYSWFPSATDGYNQTNGTVRYFIVLADPVSTVWQQGADPTSGSVGDVNLVNGNLFKSQTDVAVKSLGPGLDVTRSYNSLDTRTNGGFGRGWSFPWDTTATNVAGTGVTISRADGRREFYGQNPDGSYVNPLGSAATLTPGTAPDGNLGGWTLTEANLTKYLFNSTGKLAKMIDEAGRTVTATFTGSNATTVTAQPGGRYVNFGWTTPSGATSPHITSMSTQAVTGQGVLSWTYMYSGDKLTDVYDPQNGLVVGTSPHTHYNYNASGAGVNQMSSWLNPKGNTMGTAARIGDN